jgi:hypothetical protein
MPQNNRITESKGRETTACSVESVPISAISDSDFDPRLSLHYNQLCTHSRP